MIFVAQMVASPIQATEVRFPAPRVQIVESATADTQRIALVREGVLQDDFPTLVTSAARIAIGANGLTRLKNFFAYSPDGTVGIANQSI